MSKHKLLIIIIILLTLVFFAYWGLVLSPWAKIDRCLDGGGRWDEKRSICQKNPYQAERDNCISKNGLWDYTQNMCVYIKF